MSELYVKAVRNKFRFSSSKGQLNLEDLWTLSLESLDAIAVALDAEIEKVDGKSFIKKSSAASTELKEKLDIVKGVILTKQEEATKRKESAEKENQRAFLKNLLAEKQVEALKGLSEAEILKRIKDLE